MKTFWTKKTTLLVAFAALIGCQSEGSQTENEAQGAGGSAGALPYRGEDTGVACETDNDCSDGAFCNGQETCFEGTCHLSAPPNCDDGIECTTDTCSHSANNCVFAAPDEDGDGHADATCLGPDDVPLGDDCDDEDSNNYPGNSEVCALDDPTHDEDCDSSTFGYLDADLDGVVSTECCNDSGDGAAECGTDCDDDNFRRYPDHVEICDGIDNNCDDEVDVNTSEVPWYPDDDGDNFGQADSEDAVLSCAPVEGYSLRPSDCDDESPAIHIAAIEECDGFDNDCDGEVDEDGVCACSPNGNARPCACSNERSGIQVCAAGLWATCNCDECVEGETDCVAGILPRVCTDGQWEFLKACTGQFSECNAGVCTCPGGGLDCPLGSGAGGASGVGGASGAGGGVGAGGAPGGGGALGGGGAPQGGSAGIGGAPSTGAVGGQGGSAGTTPGLAPIVISTVPSMGAAFDIDGVVSFTFDQDMDPGGLEFIALLDALGNTVPGESSVTDNVLTITPDVPLASGMEYSLALPASAMDMDGEPLANPFTLRFFTEPLTNPLPLTGDTGLNYNQGRLSVSPAGMVTAILREEDPSLPSERAVALDFNGLDWDAAEEVSAIWPSFGFEVAVDDQGWVMATAYDGSTLAQYDRQASIWSGPVTYTSASGSTTRNLATLSGVGRGFYIFQDAGTTLRIHARDVSGSYDAPVGTALLNDEKRAVAINESGEGVIGTVVSGALRVIHSETDLSNWTVDSLDLAIWSQDVAVGSDGKKYVAFSQNGGGNPLDQVFVRVHDGSWGSAIDVVTAVGNGDEYDPLIGVDDSGNVTIAFRKNGELWTGRMTAGSGVFTGVFKIGLAQPSTLGKYLMEVSPGGDVVLAFVQSTANGTNLWAARYQTGIGWGLPHLLESSSESVTAFDLGMDDNGNAYVLYEVAEIDGDESYLVVVP